MARDEAVSPPAALPAPAALLAEGAEPFPLHAHLSSNSGFPRLDWAAVTDWIQGLAPAQRAEAWSQAEIAWLSHLRDCLGQAYRVERIERALLLSSLEPNVARSTLNFMTKSLARIHRVLDGLAVSPEWGHDVLLVLDDDEAYYQYVSHFYEGTGEFARSGGMFVNDGCSHFVTMKSDLRVIEPTIVHEMTHSCLSHLPIPAWLNEGLAVNTERRLSAPLGPEPFTPAQMHAKHRAYWGPSEIQEFWSGKSWLRPDDANMLSYDLARILVAQFAADWTPFRNFALSADIADSGRAAAIEHLGIHLGTAVCAVLEREPTEEWQPEPTAWPEPPERGAFRRNAASAA